MSENLRHLHQLRPRHDDDAVRERLAQASITAGVILEPSEQDPRRFTAPGTTDRVADEAQVTMAPPTTPSRLPRSAPGDGLRLVPLAAFHWGGAPRGRFGGRSATIAPRVRGDHILIYVAQGTLGVDLPGLRHPVSDGRIAFIPAGTAFSMQPPEEVQGCALMIPPHLAHGLPVELPHSFQSGLPDPADHALLDPALRALGAGSPRNAVEASATSFQLGLLAVALSRLVHGSAAQQALSHRITEARPLTERFLALAGANLAQEHTMSELARDLGCTLAHLDRACLQSRGKTALELLYRLRLERAVGLLRDTTTPIEQIARSLGFSSVGHFMRAFASATGRSPEAFREIGRGGEEQI
ncbi:helix-turn-helix domain-containing protein [Paracoccus laeviglucosivorans]|uniref:Transcriptional regulator, AraC family n=1 Tax=Paracoccus laeviglucosivorans TaxID=1197861 RepID=A0A521BY39_9RHOB|nr:AraC family transcriptional regulator [Paracoccus laeviglucosivorans]SMO52119.1 transcriptional regulator, AraC family [Paracoccus laeviglucosivorans]